MKFLAIWRSVLVGTLLAAVPVTSYAEMYKCVDNGKTIYQGTPCAGSGGVVTVKPAGGSAPATPTVSVIDKAPGPEKSSADRAKEHLKGMEIERRQREVDNDIADLDREINGYRAALDQELAALSHKKIYAKNNLAGATYEHSISSEMQAVSEKYKVKIQIAQDRLAAVRLEAADLRKAH